MAITSKSVTYWTYQHPGSTGIAVRGSASTSGTYITRLSSGNKGTKYCATSRTGSGTSSNPYWIYFYYKGGTSGSQGWAATYSSGFTYFTSSGSGTLYSGTAYAWYYWPNAGSTTYTRQYTATRTKPSFTLRSSPGSNTVNGSATTIKLTINYNNGSANGSKSGSYQTPTVYTFSGWDEKTSASAPSNLTAGTSDYAAGASRSSNSDLYYYADYTSKAGTTVYSNNSYNLGSPTKSSTSTTYTVTYNANGGSVSPASATTSRTTTYTFSKWTGTTGVTISGTTATFTQNGTATASYTSSNGAVGKVTLPTPSRANHTCLGWSTSSTATTATYACGAQFQPSSTSTTLYAVWKLSTVTLTLVNSAGWTDSTYGPKGGGNYQPGQTGISISQALKTGYHFVNWTNASGTQVAASASATITMPTTSATYTANVALNTYTVTYDGNGSTGGSTASSSHTYSVAKNLTANGFTKLGYTFQGWATTLSKANAGTVDYADKASVTNLTATHQGTVTLYAVWKPFTNMYIWTNKKDGTYKWVPVTKHVYTSK